MLIYFIVLLICFLPQFIKEFNEKELKILIIVLVGFFVCFGYMTGSDWRAYEKIYYAVDSYSLENLSIEYGYYYYMLIFRYLNIDFWTFFIFTKIITYFIWTRFILKHQTKYFYLSFCLFIFFYGLNLFIDNPMRTLMAATIFLFSYKHLVNRNLKSYLFFTLLASTFHIVSILMIPLYWLVKFNIRTRIIIILYITINIIFWFFDSQLRDLFQIQSGNSYIDSKINFYFSEGAAGKMYTVNRIISLGLLVRYILFALILKSRKKIEMRLGNVFFNLVVFSFFFHRLGISIPIFGRLEFYVCIIFCIVVVEVIDSLTHESMSLYKVFLLLIISLSTFKSITSEYKYIPYTNYIPYIFQDQKPSYEERSNYNFQHSPYGKK